jgi:IS30 family transposase
VPSRRIPKGPGRRPKSHARSRFMELIAKGWPLMAAAREVGVSRTAAYIWGDGTTVRRKNGTVKVVPPLEPFALRRISLRFLSQEKRAHIADMASKGHGPTVIAAALSRSPSTISRELRRNVHESVQYRPLRAHSIAADQTAPATRTEADVDAALKRVREGEAETEVEPAVDQPRPARPASGRPGHAARDGKHLPRDLSARIRAAVQAGPVAASDCA